MSGLDKVMNIALNTVRETIRSKILYSLFFFLILLLAVSAFFGTVTIGDQEKVIKDFGLFALSLFSVLYAVISGSLLLAKELQRKTLYNLYHILNHFNLFGGGYASQANRMIQQVLNF